MAITPLRNTQETITAKRLEKAGNPENEAPTPPGDGISIKGAGDEELPLMTRRQITRTDGGSPSGSETAEATASSMLPGPLSLPVAGLLKTLSKHEVKFVSQRLFRIPGLMEKNCEVSSDEAARIITEKGEGARQRLFVSVDGEGLVAFSGKEDVERLAAFNDPSGQGEHCRKLVKTLKNADALQCSFHNEDHSVGGAYGAFRSLTLAPGDPGFPSKPVTVSYDEHPLFTLEPGKAEDLDHGWKKLNDLGYILSKLEYGDASIVAKLMRTFPEVPLDFRIDIANTLTMREYDEDGMSTDFCGEEDYQKLLDTSKNADDFMKLSKYYTEARALMIKDEDQSYDLEKAFSFIAGTLKDSPEDYQVYMKLLKNGVSTGMAKTLHRALPRPLQPGEYERSATEFLAYRDWSYASIEHAMKPVFDVPLKDRIAVVKGLERHMQESYGADDPLGQKYDALVADSRDGSDFVTRGTMLVELLDAGKQRWEPFCDNLPAMIAGRFASHPEEYQHLMEMLNKGMRLEKALKVETVVSAPLEGTTFRERTAAFDDIFMNIYKENDNFTEKALVDYGVLNRTRPSGESMGDSVKRLKYINSTLQLAPFNKKLGMKKIAAQARDLLLRVHREKEKGIYGDRSLDEALSLVLEKIVFAQSLNEARKEALASLGMKETDLEILESDGVIMIDGIKLDIKADDDE